MATVKLVLTKPINASLQAKSLSSASNTLNMDSGAWDIIYFTRIDSTTCKQSGDIYRLGKCVGISSDINTYSIIVEADSNAQTPDKNDFIFFGKENKVNRFQDIVLQHYTENGMIVEKFSGQNAQIIQHEIDHLNGIHIFNKGDK